MFSCCLEKLAALKFGSLGSLLNFAKLPVDELGLQNCKVSMYFKIIIFKILYYLDFSVYSHIRKYSAPLTFCTFYCFRFNFKWMKFFQKSKTSLSVYPIPLGRSSQAPLG